MYYLFNVELFFQNTAEHIRLRFLGAANNLV